MYPLWCIVIGESTPFPVAIGETQSVGELKDAIKKKKPAYLKDIDADGLTLYQVNIDASTDENTTKEVENISPNLDTSKKATKLRPMDLLSTCTWELDPTKQTIHILVKVPKSESIDPSLW
jgi:Crinkler effector protein N-terminal domain